MSHINKRDEAKERELIKGYLEMAAINLEEAEGCAEACNEALRACEEKLTECE